MPPLWRPHAFRFSSVCHLLCRCLAFWIAAAAHSAKARHCDHDGTLEGSSLRIVYRDVLNPGPSTAWGHDCEHAVSLFLDVLSSRCMQWSE